MPSRFITALTFMLIGPPAGALWLVCCTYAKSLLNGEQDAFSNALESLPIMLTISYVAASLPAFVAGITFAALPIAWRRAVIAFFIGAIVTGLFLEFGRTGFGVRARNADASTNPFQLFHNEQRGSGGGGCVRPCRAVHHKTAAVLTSGRCRAALFDRDG